MYNGPSPGNYGQPYGSPSYRNPVRRRRSGCGCISGVFTLLIVGFVLLTLTLNVPEIDVFNIFHGAVNNGNTVLNTTAHPTLIVESETYNKSSFGNSDSAPIHIHVGSSSKSITIQSGNVTGDSSRDDEKLVIYNQTHDGSVTSLTVHSQHKGTVDILVPMLTDLKVQTNSASIEVDGVNGRMVLQTNSGLITITKSSILTASVLSSNSGAVNVRQSSVVGTATFAENSAPLTFNGTLSPQANCRFSAISALLDVTLPHSASFHIDATTASGSLNVDFPGVTATAKEAHNDVGGSPRAHITLSNASGSIKLHSA